MKKSEIIWEASLAFIAFAGAFTLLSNFFPHLPSYIFGLFFLFAFVFICVSLCWRLHEASHPVKVVGILAGLNCNDAPASLTIHIKFISHETTNISKYVLLRLNKKLEADLKQIISNNLFRTFTVDTGDDSSVMKLERGGYASGMITIPFYTRNKRSTKKLAQMQLDKKLDGKIEVGWATMERKGYTWNKIETVWLAA